MPIPFFREMFLNWTSDCSSPAWTRIISNHSSTSLESFVVTENSKLKLPKVRYANLSEELQISRHRSEEAQAEAEAAQIKLDVEIESLKKSNLSLQNQLEEIKQAAVTEGPGYDSFFMGQTVWRKHTSNFEEFVLKKVLLTIKY